MFYFRWLGIQYDSSMLTFLKNFALVLPPIALIHYLATEGAKYKFIHLRNKKYVAPLMWGAVTGAIILSHLCNRFQLNEKRSIMIYSKKSKFHHIACFDAAHSTFGTYCRQAGSIV